MSKPHKSGTFRMEVQDYLAEHPDATRLEANTAVLAKLQRKQQEVELQRDFARMQTGLTDQQKENIGGQPVPCLSDGGQSMGVWVYCDLAIEHDGKHAGWAAVQLSTTEDGTRAVAHRTEWED